MIDPHHPKLSIRRQCQLIGLNRATYYWKPKGISELNLKLIKTIDKEYTKRPFYGYRKMTRQLQEKYGHRVNHKRVARLMQKMGLQAVCPRPNTSIPNHEHKKYPYLLRNMEIKRPNQVWSTDITYVPMPGGFMYLTAVIDWYSRFVIAWQLSNTLEAEFCVDTLKLALQHGKPEIFNTDQGAQFTANAFVSVLEKNKIQISMDGRGRAFDNIFVERLWRTVKYEDIYIKSYATVLELYNGLNDYFRFYNYERMHQSLDYQTPAKVYLGKQERLTIPVDSHLNSIDSWS